MVDFYPNFQSVYQTLKQKMRLSPVIHTEKWQGVEIKSKPEMKMHEILYESFMSLITVENLNLIKEDIKPNLPWADDHFQERVCGLPLNPGEEWANWPWGHSADKFRIHEGQFDHTYMERYWPKFASENQSYPDFYYNAEVHPRSGIRFSYGDLDDVVELLLREPLTRQAYLPVWFPEDTGVKFGGRVPCTIGYHFLLRENQLSITYQIRSCDFFRHYSDDVYLTVRLLIWVLDQLRARNKQWRLVTPGLFIMHIGSLHMFINDHIRMFGGSEA